MEYAKLFGKERIASYNNIKEHNKNLRLIGAITSRLAAIELILRNKLDFYLSEKDESWIFEEDFYKSRVKTEEKYKKDQKNYEKVKGLRLDKYQYLSNLTFGEIKASIKREKLGKPLAKYFNTDALDVKKLAKSNIALHPTRCLLPTATKFYQILELLRVLRNRSFHWENILKVDGKVPRIRAFDTKYCLGLHPRNIEFFLNYLLNAVDTKLLWELKAHP